MAGDVALERLKEAISFGKPVLFAGAGFSLGCEGCYQDEALLAEGLANGIGTLGGFDGAGDLSYAAGRYLKQLNKPETLISLLKDWFYFKEVSEVQVEICKIPWKGIYTTNYDNAIELAYAKNNVRINSLDSTYPLSALEVGRPTCIHINGTVEKLSPEALDTTFKLTSSSYLSPEGFKSSCWNEQFRRDIMRCSALVFVGYSLYDISIKEILFELPELAQKVFFITRSDISEKDKYILSEFGTVVPIESKGFASWLNEIGQFDFPEDSFESLMRHEYVVKPRVASDRDIDALLLYGDCNGACLEPNIIQKDSSPYIVKRRQLSMIAGLLRRDHVVVVGELANGKSILLESLKPYLTQAGYDVYTIGDEDGDYFSDIEVLKKNGRKSVIIMDDYSNNIDMLMVFAELLPSSVKIVASCRTSEHEYHEYRFQDTGVDFCEVSVDFLNDEEVGQFIDLIDNAGFWGDVAHSHSKQSSIVKLSQRQISLSLLEIIESPHVKEKVSKLVKELIVNEEHKKTIFAICCLALLRITPDDATIATVSGTDAIYTKELRKNKNFKQLFGVTANGVNTKSSLFCQMVVRNNFTLSFMREHLLSLAAKLDKLRQDNKRYENLFKATLRFSFLQEIFPSQGRTTSFSLYYEKLKVHVSWLKYDPHFWLQYGMAQMSVQDFDRAQRFLKEAYGRAGLKAGYYTDKIDTQQARLFLLLGISANDASESYKFFNQAHELISRLNKDTYTLKQIRRYTDYYEKKYQTLSRKNKTNFIYSCRGLLKSLEEEENSSSGQYRLLRALDYSISRLRSIIEDSEGVLAT
ncbi:MAG: SIR2 family protein [Halodesulfovibrio sp.]|uniref:SIR2 family protein n=1 Tax=Halodesulfovibrio sp. TaxID=1912772 RepID=UPI00359D67EE